MTSPAFDRWLRDVSRLHDELLGHIEASVGLPPAKDVNARVCRDVPRELLRASEWIVTSTRHAEGFLTRREVVQRLRILGMQYERLELAEPVANAALRESVTQSLANAWTRLGWYQGRLFALTIVRAALSSSVEVQCCVLEAYLVGVLEYVYPQWVPSFHVDVLSLGDGHALPKLGELGNAVVLAGRLNAAFAACAGLGEWTGTLLLMARYAQTHCEASHYRLVATAAARITEEMATRLRRELGSLTQSVRDPSWIALGSEVRQLVAVGAAKYCEMMIDYAYGQAEGGLPRVLEGEAVQVALNVVGASFDDASVTVFRDLFPDPHYNAALDYCRAHAMGGLIRGVLGCDYLLRFLRSLDDKTAFSLARRAFLSSIEQRMKSMSHVPIDEVSGALVANTIYAFSKSA